MSADAIANSATHTSPWLQALRIAFIAFYACTLLAAARWLTSNVVEVGAGNRAVVLHFGEIVREQSSGLLWAWPQPIDEVVLVQAAETVVERHVQALARSQAAISADAMAYDDDEGGPVSDALAGSGYLLTGDGAIVQLDVRVFYKVTEPRAYVLQYEHVLPALDRVVTRSALAVCAARDLDRILVARPELLATGNADAEEREQLRKDLLGQINRALGDLRQRGLGLGIEAIRVDVQSALPRDTLNAFNSVLTASQQTEQELADARSAAARILQQATQAADRSLQVAGANASERISKAQADTATVTYLAASVQKGTEPGLLLRVYRERLPNILKNAGAITTVDPRTDAKLVISGIEK
jgi:regulator of protease activity HflC (stomatin/prohibitin superfamily)